MNYYDEDEDNNLFYQRYKNKNKNKPKNTLNEQNNNIKNDKKLKKKRQRHDSSSEDENENKKENEENIIETNKIKIENITNQTSENEKKEGNNNNLISEEQKELLSQLKETNTNNKEKEKLELIKENYENLMSWSKGLIQINNEIKNDNNNISKIDLQKIKEDPMSKMIKNDIIKSKEEIRGFYLPKCKYPGTINRFNIDPGYRWDGIDRSNGFEKKYINHINNKNEFKSKYDNSLGTDKL